jgi:hypothetical protein
MLNLAAQAEAESFVIGSMHLTDDFGLPRIQYHGKTKIKTIRTSLGDIEAKVPLMVDKTPEEPPRVKFESFIYPNWMKTKMGYNAPLVWRYLEGMATGDFHEARRLLIQRVRSRTKGDSFWIKRFFEANYMRFLSRDLSQVRNPLIWLDRVDFNRRGLDKDSRLLVAAGMSVTAKVTLLGLHRVNKDDYNGWRDLFIGLKEQGLKEVPQLAGAVTREVIKGVKLAFPGFKPFVPDREHVLKILALMPQVRTPAAKNIFKDYLTSNSVNIAYFHLARFIEAFSRTDPRVVISLLNPHRIKLFEAPPTRKRSKGAAKKCR